MTAPVPPPVHAQLVLELAHRNDELAALDTIGRAAARSTDLSDFLDEAGRIVEELTRCAALAVYTHDAKGNALDLLHSRGIPAEIVAGIARAPVLPPAVVTTAHGVADVVEPSVYPARFQAVFAQAGVCSMARVPLVVGSRIIGVLVVGFGGTATEQATVHLRFLRPVGALIGAVVSSDRLLGSLRRRVTELTLLNDLAVASAQLDPIYLLDGALRRIAEVFDAAVGAAFLRHDDGLHSVALLGFPPEKARDARVVPFGRGPCGAAVERREVVAYTDPEAAGALFAENMRGQGLHAVVGVPLLTKEEPVGGLMLARRTAQPFTEEEQRFLATLGAQLGVAVENSRLFAEARGLEVDLGKSHAELERAQALLLQRERLAALGALSAAVAHEVRNPLGVIFNAVGMLRRHRGMDDEGRGLVDIVGEEAERLNRIVADLLGFARPTQASLRPAPLGPIVEEAVRAALAGSRTPVDVSWELAPDLPPVAVDAGLVRQALINLVLNAAQAMARGGRLRVRTAASGGWASVEVIDTGHGIPAELRERIFEPFFTTRTSGTGLGLAIVKHVVEVHGGAIDVQAGAEGGTRFALRFPVVQLPGAPSTRPLMG